MTIESRIATLEQKIAELKQLAARVSLRDTPPPPQQLLVQVISGQFMANISTGVPPAYPVTVTLNGAGALQYAPDPMVITQHYNTDPTQDSIVGTVITINSPTPGDWTATGPVYPPGLGNGVLLSGSGAPLGRVLIRHNWNGFTDPIMAGICYTAGQPIVVNVFDGSTVQAYPVVGMW